MRSIPVLQEREDDLQVESTRTIRQLEGRLTLKVYRAYGFVAPHAFCCCGVSRLQDEALQTKERQVISLRSQLDDVRKQWEDETAQVRGNGTVLGAWIWDPLHGTSPAVRLACMIWHHQKKLNCSHSIRLHICQ